MRIFGIQLTPNHDEVPRDDDDRDGDDDDLVDGRHDAAVDETDLPEPLSARAAADNVDAFAHDESPAAVSTHDESPAAVSAVADDGAPSPKPAKPSKGPKGKNGKKRTPKTPPVAPTPPVETAAPEPVAGSAPREDLKALFPEVQWRDIPDSETDPDDETPPVIPIDEPAEAAGDAADTEPSEDAAPAAAPEDPPPAASPVAEDGEQLEEVEQDSEPESTPDEAREPSDSGVEHDSETETDDAELTAQTDEHEPAAEADREPSADAAPPIAPPIASPAAPPAGDATGDRPAPERAGSVLAPVAPASATDGDPSPPTTGGGRRTRVRLGVLALVVAAVVAGVIVPTLPIWQTPQDAVVAEAPQTSGAPAVAWLDANVDRGDPVAVPDPLRDAVVAAGWQAGDVLPREREAAIPAVADWVVAPASDTTLDQDSVAVATFGDGADAIVVRAVVAGGEAAYRSAETARSDERRQYGAELAENPALVVGDVDRALITGGAVDSRILLVLGAFTSAGPVVVDAFGVVDGEADVPRRTVTLSEVGDQRLVRDGALTTAGIALVQALADDFSPATASFTDDALTLRYPLDLGTTTTPEESS